MMLVSNQSVLGTSHVNQSRAVLRDEQIISKRLPESKLTMARTWLVHQMDQNSKHALDTKMLADRFGHSPQAPNPL